MNADFVLLAGFSLLGVAGFFIARRRRQSGADMKLNRVKK